MISFFSAILVLAVCQVSKQQSGFASDDRTEVSCSLNYMRIEIDRKAFNASKYSTINLLDSKCKARLSKTKIILDSAPHLCGSKRVETKKHIIYQNEVYMKATPTGKLVTREHDVRVAFSCHYTKSGITSMKSFEPQTIIDVKEDGFGDFQFHFKMFKDGAFKQAHSKYPIEATLSDTLFFEANSTSNDDDLVILIDECFATPTVLYQTDPLKYTFIEDMCPLESNVKFHKAGSKKQRFSMQAFSFIKEVTTVYIHCVVFMCRKSASISQCTSGCQGNNVNRVRRDLPDTTKKAHSQYKLLDLGPLRHKREVPKSGAHEFPYVTVGLVIGMAVLGVIIALTAVKIRSSRNGGANDHVIIAQEIQKEPLTVKCEDENLL